MQDITDLMLTFREAIRHAWNTYFINSASPMGPDIQEAFSKIEIGYFQSIVLIPIGLFNRGDDYRKKPLDFMLVRPAERLSSLSAQIAEPNNNRNVTWSTPIAGAIDEETTFEFFDFFDWIPYESIDLSYVRARVLSWNAIPNSKGALALLQHADCRFFARTN